MNIAFPNNRLRKHCSSIRSAQRKWGKRGGEFVMRRLDELRAADALDIMRCLPQARCHELSQNRKGQLAVYVEHPRRLIFESANNPTPQKEDGGLDWTRVTAIRVLEVVDYHGD